MTGCSTIVTAGSHYVLGIIDYSSAQTNANIFSNMRIHDILDPRSAFPANSVLSGENLRACAQAEQTGTNSMVA